MSGGTSMCRAQKPENRGCHLPPPPPCTPTAPPPLPPPPPRLLQVVWYANDSKAMLGWVEKDVEAYLVMDPLTDKAMALRLCEALRKHFSEKHICADFFLHA